MFGGVKKLSWRRKERGSILALAAVGSLSLVLASGMAIDISHFYTAGTELQNAADAAALAGASALNHTGDGIKTAADRPVAAMNKYDFNGAAVTIDRSKVRFAVNLSSFDGTGTGMSEAQAKASPDNIRFVKVDVPTTAIKTYFASTILGSAVSMNRKAVAGPSSTSVGVNTICNASPMVLFEGEVDAAGIKKDLKVVDHNQETCDCFCDNSLFQPGHTYELKMMDCSNKPNGGEFTIIDKPTKRAVDKNSWAQKLLFGLDECITSCDAIPTTATKVSDDQVVASINTRLDQYSGIPTTMAPADLNVKDNITYSTYKAGTGAQAPTQGAGRADRRIMVIPIARISDYNHDNKKVSNVRYGVFFLTKKAVVSGGVATMQLEFITDSVVVGDSSYNPTIACNSSTMVTVPVLYR